MLDFECTHAAHEALCADKQKWEAGTTPAAPQVVDGVSLIQGHCTCGSTLIAKYPGSGYPAVRFVSARVGQIRASRIPPAQAVPPEDALRATGRAGLGVLL